MYSVLISLAFAGAAEQPDALFARRAGAGCTGNAAVARAAAGCNGAQAVALVPVQTYAAVRVAAVNQGCNGGNAVAAAAGCSGSEARGLFHRGERVAARRAARRQGAHVDNSLPVVVASPPVAAQLPAQPPVAQPKAKSATVQPTAMLTQPVFYVRGNSCPNGRCPN